MTAVHVRGCGAEVRFLSDEVFCGREGHEIQEVGFSSPSDASLALIQVSHVLESKRCAFLGVSPDHSIENSFVNSILKFSYVIFSNECA